MDTRPAPLREPVLRVAPARDGSALELVVVSAANVATIALATIAGTLLALGHRERLETVFFLSCMALAPASVALAKKQLLRVGPRKGATLAMLCVAVLSAVILSARAAVAIGGTSLVPWVLLTGAVVIVGLQLVVCHRADLLPGPLQGAPRTTAVIAVCGLLGAAAASFYPRSLFTPERLWLCLVLALMIAAGHGLRRSESRSRAGRVAIDALVLTTIVLVVTDVNDYAADNRYDYDFFLGPVNAMRHGHPLLVDTFSQYGAGMFYALAGAFHAVPLTYGGLQAVLCIAYVLEFALVYGVLRLACRSQLVAVIGLSVALVANLVVPLPPYIAYPSTGPLRFCLPWLVIFAGTLRARHASHRLVFEAAMLLTVGAAAVWSAETFVYTLAAYAAIAVFSVEPVTERSLHVAKRLAAAIVVAFLSLGATSALVLVIAGDWPRWTEYLSLVALYAMRGFGSLLIPTWSPGYLVGALYVVSLIALIALPRSSRLHHGPAIATTAGATAFGAMAFTYFLGRSAPSNLHHVAIPAVVVACSWWTIAWPHLSRMRAVYTWAGLYAVSLVVASVVAANSNATGRWLGATPLAQTIRSPVATASRVSTLLTNTQVDPRVVEGARLVREHSTPAGRSPVVLIRADRLTAVLLAAGRGNALPIVNAQSGGAERRAGAQESDRCGRQTPRGTFVLTETTFMRRPAESFAHLDPINDRIRFGDYFVARSFERLAERVRTATDRPRTVRIRRARARESTDDGRGPRGTAGLPKATRRMRTPSHGGFDGSSSSSPCARESATSAPRSPSRTSSRRFTPTSSRRPTRDDHDRDRFVLSKGHASLAVYAALYLREWLTMDELSTYCADGTRLGTHPEAGVRGVDFATGSLGHGLSLATGAALAGRLHASERRAYLPPQRCRVQRGIRLGGRHVRRAPSPVESRGHRRPQRAAGARIHEGRARPVADGGALARRSAGTCTRSTATTSSLLADTIRALDFEAGPPHVLVAHTVFGKGVSFMESSIEWHYLPMTEGQYDRAMTEVAA